MRQRLFFILFGEINVRQLGAIFYFIFKIWEWAWAIFILWPQIVRWGWWHRSIIEIFPCLTVFSYLPVVCPEAACLSALKFHLLHSAALELSDWMSLWFRWIWSSSATSEKGKPVILCKENQRHNNITPQKEKTFIGIIFHTKLWMPNPRKFTHINCNSQYVN